MKINKKEIRNRINTCLVLGKYEQVEILEKALEIFNLAPWYSSETGMVEKIIETE